MKTPGIIFDLDGTLVDSVYQHVSTWNDTLRAARITVAQWRIHRAIGMGGSLFLPKLLRDEGIRHSTAVVTRLEAAHQKHFDRTIGPHPRSSSWSERVAPENFWRDSQSRSQLPQAELPGKRNDFSPASQIAPTVPSLPPMTSRLRNLRRTSFISPHKSSNENLASASSWATACGMS